VQLVSLIVKPAQLPNCHFQTTNQTNKPAIQTRGLAGTLGFHTVVGKMD
jgi:hypothetical protein